MSLQDKSEQANDDHDAAIEAFVAYLDSDIAYEQLQFYYACLDAAVVDGGLSFEEANLQAVGEVKVKFALATFNPPSLTPTDLF